MPNGPSGYEIERVLSVWNACRQALLDGELATDESQIADLLGDAEANVDQILARLLRGARHAKTMTEAAAQEIDDLQARKARFAARNEAFRDTARQIMEITGRRKLELPDLTASIRAGQPHVVVTDEEAITDEYKRITVSVDKRKLLDDMKVGVVVEGAELSNSSPSLTIRTR